MLNRYLATRPFLSPRIVVGQIAESRDVVGFDLIEEDGKHDVAMITIRYPLPARGNRPTVSSAALWPTSTPVSVTWDPKGIYTDTFYGYVRGHTAKRDITKTLNRVLYDVTYICTGSSFPMMSTNSKDWGTVSASYIATTLAKAYGLRAVVDPHPLVQPFNQFRTSDYKFLADLANRIGYRFRVTGGTLYFTNPMREFEMGRRQGVAEFSMYQRPNQTDTLRTFQTVEGETLSDGGVAAKHEITLSRGNGRPLKATSAAYQHTVFGESEGGGPNLNLTLASTQYTPTNYAEAQALVDAEALKNFYWVAATATTAGDARVHPGGVVMLDGDALNTEYQGSWMVKRAHHRISRSTYGRTWREAYDMDLTLGRNATAQSVTRVIPAEWLAAVAEVPVVQQNGLWIAGAPGG
jgi:phage protein D